MAAALYRDLLAITEEMEALLVLEGYDERLTSLFIRRQELFVRLALLPPEKQYAVLIKRIRRAEEKCMALTRDKMAAIQGDLVAMHTGRRAVAAYGRQG